MIRTAIFGVVAAVTRAVTWFSLPENTSKWVQKMKAQRSTCAFAALMIALLSSPTRADPAGDLLDSIVALNKVGLEQQDGYLFKGWLQFDPENPTYVVYIGDRKYTAVLDDGRGTSEKAKRCKTENFFDENPATGCPVKFDGEYLVEDKSGAVEVTLKIWNVGFAGQ